MITERCLEWAQERAHGRISVQLALVCDRHRAKEHLCSHRCTIYRRTAENRILVMCAVSSLHTCYLLEIWDDASHTGQCLLARMAKDVTQPIGMIQHLLQGHNQGQQSWQQMHRYHWCRKVSCTLQDNFYCYTYMVSCGALQWNFEHKMTLIYLKVPYYHNITLSSNDERYWTEAGADPGFLVVWGINTREGGQAPTYKFARFSQKLHDRKFWLGGDAGSAIARGGSHS